MSLRIKAFPPNPYLYLCVGAYNCSVHLSRMICQAPYFTKNKSANAILECPAIASEGVLEPSTVMLKVPQTSLARN
jgi:hypothetical protein